MITIRAALFAILLSTTAASRAQSISGGDLANLCSSAAETERTACLLIVKAFMDGFIEGVGKGVVDTYKHDAEVASMVGGVPMKDMAPRINAVAAKSTCIQRVTVAEMAATVTSYITANPGARKDNYRTAITRAIVSAYCPK